MSTRIVAMIAIAVLAFALAGCEQSSVTTPDQQTARFVGYTEAPDGSKIAIVESPQLGETTARIDADDLKPGDTVYVTDPGKDWDQPQYLPSLTITGEKQ